MTRTCKKCGEDWVIDPIEAELFRSKASGVPRVCTSCRALARNFLDVQLPCSKCDTQFAWPKELALYASMFDWKEPHRCPGGCNGDLEEVKRFRGDMYAIGPVWLRRVRGIDLDAAPVEELTPEQQLRATKVPRLDDLFRGLGSGMSGGPNFSELSSNSGGSNSPSDTNRPAPADDLPRENLPSPDSLFSNFKK